MTQENSSWESKDVYDEPGYALENDAVGKEKKILAIPTFQILYQEQSGFGVFACEDEKEDIFTIKGTFISPLILGQTYQLEGKVIIYKGEKQLQVNQYRNVKPINEKGIISYLQTLKGLKSRAENIYEVFGVDSIDVLMNDPMKVCKMVKGIGKKSVVAWQEQLEKMKDSQSVLVSLMGFGLTINQSKKLCEKFSDVVVDMINENPYILSKEVRGYGFLTCDRIARNMGYDIKSPYRIQEGLIHCLESATNDGHCFLPAIDLLVKTSNLLSIRLSIQEMTRYAKECYGANEFLHEAGGKNYTIKYQDMSECIDKYYNAKPGERDTCRYVVDKVDEEEVLKEIECLLKDRRIVMEDNKVYLTPYYFAELEVAECVNEIIAGEKEIKWDNNKVLMRFCKNKNYALEAKQKLAVIEFTKSTGGFYILNGSAGCGKTFSLKIILSILEEMYQENFNREMDVLLMAPTGKASKVAGKATEIPCVTVHRGLGYNPVVGYEFNDENQFEADVVIIDESSMLDIMLTRSLLKAIQKRGTKVIFLGDTKQLPSVGAGNVLADLIACNKVKVVTLDVVKRQGEKSGIIRNINKLLDGKMIEDCLDTGDAFVLKKNTVEDVQKTIISSIRRIQKNRGLSLDEIQVLCPQKAGAVGTEYLNFLLQTAFNPLNEENKILNKKITLGSYGNNVKQVDLFFKKGDKVIHTKNNYEMSWYEKGHNGDYIKCPNILGVTNGECGIIEEIRKGKNSEGEIVTQVIVKYDDYFVIYEDGVRELDHAYALTIHKSQGSQWGAVIMPIMNQNRIMLDVNLFYTGYSRAKDMSIVIGEVSAIKYAIETYRSRDRYTTLCNQIA